MKADRDNRKGKATADVIVIGAGPAGAFAAIRASQLGANVIVLERQNGPGRKLLATGGGRCNVTNSLSTADFINRFGAAGRFMTNALKELSSSDLLRLLDSWNVPCEAADGFHYFPRSQKAGDVLNALSRQMAEHKVRLYFNVSIKDISAHDDSITISTSDGKSYIAHSVIMATGGTGYPVLGGSTSGYELAQNAGHTIIKPVPGLVGLRTLEKWPGQCAGITLPDVQVKIEERGFKGRACSGDLLFTHRGISGPPVIDISGSVCRLLLTKEPVRISLQLCRNLPTLESWLELLSTWRQNNGKRSIHNALGSVLPKRLATILCDQCGIQENMITARLPATAEKKLAATLTRTELHITGSEGFGNAMVTAGGVALKEINPATLASKIMPGLYFAGEILDLDGPCGGYNLQWAMASGWLAGKSAAGPVKKYTG